MMDSQEKSLTQDGGAKTKKYTREELFRLAKLMDISQSMAEELDRFEHADWSKYNLDLVETVEETETMFNSIKSFTSYGRKNSELDHEYSSLMDYRVHNEWRRSQTTAPMTRLSRMTSSPSIRYGANTMKNQISAQHDDVPIQVKAKYARLIEYMSANNANQQQTTSSSMTSSRHDLHNRNFIGSSWRDPRAPERPSTLFGPLKKETGAQKGNRGNSEEPMSLPFIPDHSVRDHHSGRWLPNTGGRGLLDYNDSSPAQRFTSTDGLKKERQAHVADEDDDFDITSLLNITVLSDIRIIRQDQQHHHGSNNRAPLTKQYSNRGRNEDVSGAMSRVKPLIRAQTSTDFTYQGRRLDGYEADQQQVNHSYFADYRAKNVSQQVSSFENREMARNKQHSINQSKDNSTTVDKSVAQIIETFKAQVKARAEEKLIESPAIHSKGFSTSTTSQGNGAIKENVPISVERKKDDLDLQREEKEVIPPPKSPTQNSVHVVDKLVRINDNEQQAELEPDLIEREGQTKAAEPVATCNMVQQNEALEDPIAKKPLQSKPVSQIPRLIRLLDANKTPTSTSLNDTKAVSVVGEQQQQLSIKSFSAGVTTTTMTKVKPRLVSQYRRLREKSLADEVEDIPK